MKQPETHAEIVEAIVDIANGLDLSATEVAAEYRRRTGVTDPDELASALVAGLDLDHADAVAAIDLLNDDEEPKASNKRKTKAEKEADRLAAEAEAEAEAARIAAEEEAARAAAGQ